MRYPVEQKAETHERIIDAAARAFREHGSGGQGIAKLMKDLGLTHGGFYRHFQSKEDLFVGAITRGLERVCDQMIAVAEAAPKGKELRAIIEHYLSVEHADQVGGGCVIAALAPEMGRQPRAVRSEINAAMKTYMSRLLPFLPGSSVAEKRRRFLILFPGMAGVLMTARMMTDTLAREEMLAAARQFYTEAFGQSGA
jgi:TetR/AcrR family transcriptional regulator, transcriptional repressor for nem operon